MMAGPTRRSVRHEHAVPAGREVARGVPNSKPTFRDIQAYFKSLEPPKYPFPDRPEKGRAAASFSRTTASACHGTYGPEGVYPNEIVALKGSAPTRAGWPVRSPGRPLQLDLARGRVSVQPRGMGYQAPPLDGIWASAPYLHNGSVPTLHALLDSKTRPSRFTRPPSTDFSNFTTITSVEVQRCDR